jgi:hypothetical protein
VLVTLEHLAGECNYSRDHATDTTILATGMSLVRARCFGASHWRMYLGYDPYLVALPHATVLQMFEWDLMADPAKGLSTRRNATL